MNLSEMGCLRPFVRYAQIVCIDKKMEYKNIAAYDFRMFFVRRGKGKFVIDGTEYTAEAGVLAAWKPGVVYSLLCEENEEMEMIGVNFDLCFSNSNLRIPIPPSAMELFATEKIVEPNVADRVGFLQNAVYYTEMYDAGEALAELYGEYKSKLKFFENKISGILLEVLTDIMRMDEGGGRPTHKSGNAYKILKLIRENYNKPLTNKSIGEMTGYHPNHVNRLVVNDTGMSLHRYLQNFRLERAMDLLQTTDMPIMRICETVGFRDFAHFSKYFKKKTGYTPTEFRSGIGSVK